MADNEVRWIEQTAIVLALSADFDSANGGYGWENATEILDMTSVAADAAEQSSKFPLAISAGKYADIYVCHAAFEMDVAAAAGDTMDPYIGYSSSSVDGTDNPAGLSGVSGVYAGYSSNLDASLRQLHLLKPMPLRGRPKSRNLHRAGPATG